MSALRPANIPSAGDIVIYRRDGSDGICLVSAFQHASHMTFHTYDDAVRNAAAFALENHVDTWYTVDGETYERMATHRQQRRLTASAVWIGASQ